MLGGTTACKIPICDGHLVQMKLMKTNLEIASMQEPPVSLHL